MADQVTAKTDADSKFTPHPEGQFPLRCVDVVNYGPTVQVYEGKVKIAEKCGLFFQSGERNPDTGELHTVSMEFTVSMFELANLRKFLEMWRGRAYSEPEAEAGVPIHKLEGHWGYAQVSHGTSKKGRTFATINSIMPLPKGTITPDLPDYERPEYVEKKKQAYAEELARHRAAEKRVTAPVGAGGFDAFPDALHNNDEDLPF